MSSIVASFPAQVSQSQGVSGRLECDRLKAKMFIAHVIVGPTGISRGYPFFFLFFNERIIMTTNKMQEPCQCMAIRANQNFLKTVCIQI